MVDGARHGGWVSIDDYGGSHMVMVDGDGPMVMVDGYGTIYGCATMPIATIEAPPYSPCVLALFFVFM
jgi:hypothetical protein